MIPLFKPLIEEDEIQAATDALRMGWLGMGSYVGEFEQELESLLGSADRKVVALGSGHAALHLGLLIAGIGPGDEVITPAFNNVSDFQAIVATGAQPVFCDVLDTNLCIDVDKAAEVITPKTKAIIPMDYACAVCDHDAVTKLALEHGLRVLHDAAHSFGSKYRAAQIGTFSDLCMFSFDPIKVITCIDGGALVVRSEREVELLREMRLIGMGQQATISYQNERAWTFDVKRAGFRYHLANLHAKVGLSQLAKLETIAQTRIDACMRYTKALAEIPELRLPDGDFRDILPFLYFVRVPAHDRDDFRQHLRDAGVDTGIHWQPGHSFSFFGGCRRGDLSVTDRAVREIVSIPLHSRMDLADQEKVIHAVRGFFGP